MGQLESWWTCGWQAFNQATGQQESYQTEAGREGTPPRCLPGPGLQASVLTAGVGDGKAASVQEMSVLCHCIHVSSLELVLALLPHW